MSLRVSVDLDAYGPAGLQAKDTSPTVTDSDGTTHENELYSLRWGTAGFPCPDQTSLDRALRLAFRVSKWRVRMVVERSDGTFVTGEGGPKFTATSTTNIELISETVLDRENEAEVAQDWSHFRFRQGDDNAGNFIVADNADLGFSLLADVSPDVQHLRLLCIVGIAAQVQTPLYYDEAANPRTTALVGFSSFGNEPVSADKVAQYYGGSRLRLLENAIQVIDNDFNLIARNPADYDNGNYATPDPETGDFRTPRPAAAFTITEVELTPIEYWSYDGFYDPATGALSSGR